MDEDFHEQRLSGIGGSDAAAALGISPWRTPYDLWCEKTGEGDALEPTEAMRWGSLLEPVIVAEYASRTGRLVKRPQEMLRSAQFPWMIGHLDGEIVGEQPQRILEVKTTRDARGWGQPGSDEIPISYAIQTHHYLALTGAEVADVAVLVSGSELRLYEVQRDEDIARLLIDQEAQFWRHVEQRAPPDPIRVEDAVHRWGRLVCSGSVTASEIELAAVERLREIRAGRAMLEEAEVEAKLTVMRALGDSGDALVDHGGALLATWRLDRGRKSYMVEARPPSRRFLLKE